MDLLEKSDDFFEFPDIQIGMLFKPMLLTIVFEDLHVWMYPFAADYGNIQLQEAAEGVIGKSWVGGQLRQSFDDFIVDAEVEQGIHHPGHGIPGTRTNRQQERFIEIAQFFTELFLSPSNGSSNLFFENLGVGLFICVKMRTHLGRGTLPELGLSWLR